MAEPLACAVLGMRRLGPVFGDPVVVTGAGTVGLLLQLLLLARGRVLLLSWTGSASGWRSPPQAGRCPGRHRRRRARWGTLRGRGRCDGGAGGDRDRVGLPGHGGRWWSSVCRQPRPRSASRRSGFIAAKSSSPGRWLSCAASARPDGGYRTAAASPACWPRSGTSRSDQHFITCSSHFPGRPLRSVTDLGVPPATEAISMPDSSPGIQAQAGPDRAGAGWRSRSRPGL